MSEEYKVLETPKYIGYYCFEHVYVGFEKKPTWFNRKMMKLFFGFDWKDNI